jgi:hypothetical protein
LSDHDDKIGKGGKPIKSNITDNDSAKMKTSKGVIQGYDGVATVDAYTQKMMQKIDTPEGRHQYSRRLGIVEPVFGHITSILGLKGFSMRGKVKVDIQWKLYCIVHNLLKIHRVGMA